MAMAAMAPSAAAITIWAPGTGMVGRRAMSPAANTPATLVWPKSPTLTEPSSSSTQPSWPGRAAVVAAVEMVEVVGRHGLPPAHVGIHAGPVVFQEGDYFGRTVNLAARIAEYARPGEVLVSQEVVDAADAAPVSFVEIGPVELKGVPGTLRLHTARRDA
jgi:class 3 adenylate cyclase